MRSAALSDASWRTGPLQLATLVRAFHPLHGVRRGPGLSSPAGHCSATSVTRPSRPLAVAGTRARPAKAHFCSSVSSKQPTSVPPQLHV